MKNKACKKHLISISAYLDGELFAPKQQKLESHLAVCHDCSGYLEELRAVSALVSSAPSVEPTQEAILELKARLCLVADATRAKACDRAPVRLSAFLDDELSAFEREQLESHLGVCPDCSGYLEALRAVSGHLRRLPQLEPRAEVIAALKARLRSADAVEQRSLAPVFSFPRITPARSALAAAAVAVVFFAVLLSMYSPFEQGIDVANMGLERRPAAVDASKRVVIDLADVDLRTARTRMLAELASEEREERDYSTEERSGGSLDVFDPHRSDTNGRIVHSVSFGDYSARRAPVSSQVLFVSYGN